MATFRGGYGLPARPSDGFRPPVRKSGIPSASSRSVSISSAEQQVVQPAGSSRAAVPITKLPSRVAQGSAARSYALPPSSATSKSHSGSSSSGSGDHGDPARPRVPLPSGSSSSSSPNRSNDGGVRSDRKSSIARRPSTSRQYLGPQATAHREPSPVRRRSRLSIDNTEDVDRSTAGSPAEIKVAKAVEIRQTVGKSPFIYPELDRYRNISHPESAAIHTIDVPYKLSTQDLPPPTPSSLPFSGSSSQLSAVSASPSTKFSESPGPGPYSRDTTPTSMSSQSPGLSVSSRIGLPGKIRQISPIQTRPPVTRRRTASVSNEVESITADPQGLAAVRESSTSASSSSTVRECDRGFKGSKRTIRLPPPPPSPPPRKSSQKFRDVKDTKQKKSGTAASASTAQVEQSSASNSPRRQEAPSRPSRDGTPDLKSQFCDPIPVIRSRIPASALSPERRGSESAVARPLPASGQLSQTNKSASTSHLPNTVEAVSRSKSIKATKTRKLSDSGLAKGTGSVSPSPPTTFNSRFPFFSRKKTSQDTKSEDKKSKESKKTLRKGPAAGTGHEGYGRVGNVRRRSGGSTGGKDSQSPQDGVAAYDSFFTDRMNPVVISGGEIITNRNASSELTRTESTPSISSRPSTDSQGTNDSHSATHQDTHPSLWPSAMPRRPPQSMKSRRPSDSSDSESPTTKSSLALRRSMQRLKISPKDPLSLPQPISTNGILSSSPMMSLDNSIISEDSLADIHREVSHEDANAHPAPRKLKKREPTRSPRKWNFFGRSNRREEKQAKNETVAATVTVVEKRQVPFYALMDSPEQEQIDSVDDVQEALRDADIDIPHCDSLEHIMPISRAITYEETPPQPAPQPARTVGMLSSGRPSRLPQVGRIPLVVSQRREPIPSPKSFSRPFRASMQLPIQLPDIYDPDSIAKGPSPPKPSTPVPDLSIEGSTVDTGTNFSSNRASGVRTSSDVPRKEGEFIAFSPRKDSEGTIATSSSSSAYGLFSASTAVIPKPTDPPVEDEIWDEYDDLLGDETLKPPLSATSSKGVPFHLETYHRRLHSDPQMESPTIANDGRKVSVVSMARTRSSTCSADMAERIKAAFQPRSIPTSMATSHPAPVARQHSTNSSKRSSKRHSTASSNRTRFSDCSSASSDYESPLAQVNLRVGSMTVSKWLTFGHVLFSDLRHQLIAGEKANRELSVLVVDGLGNDDWSFYAAETYPAAAFFNLSPRAPIPAEMSKTQSSFPLSPTNHHQIQYLSHANKFPFEAQSFDSVVYRFPIAAPEAHYRNILAESRRVLRPDGFIELAILDADLNNMGNRGRRAVRQLKERLHEVEPKTNLASTSDLIVRLLGNAGFSGIKAANVGVPVASSIPRSSSGEGSDRRASDKSKKGKEPPSLSEMMRDTSPNADAGITKMVARVGRWWYTRCYEYGSKSSMWDDKALLCECEELGTSLKLTVCCARAPDGIISS